jgi:bifunctional non-homologous end joining protein LigD
MYCAGGNEALAFL